MKQSAGFWIALAILIFAIALCRSQPPPISAHAPEGQDRATLAQRAALQHSGGPLSESYYEQVDAATHAQVSKTSIPLYVNHNLAKKGETYAFINMPKGDLVVHVNWSGLKPHKGIMRIVVNVPVE